MNGESINKRIARLRKAHGLKQSDMAEKLGLKESTYSQMERQGNITTQKLLDIAAVLNIDANILLYGEENIIIPKRPETVIFEQNRVSPVKTDIVEELPKPVTKFDVAVEAFRNLKKEQQEQVYALIQKLVDEGRK